MERTVRVASRSGLHARPAALFSETAAALGVSVALTNAAGATVDAASILGILTLGVGHDETVTLTSDSVEALETLAGMLERDLDDE
jgi:phosphocarrier protein HPr